MPFSDTHRCAACGCPARPDSRFCGECGAPLGRPDGARVERSAASAGERRQISIMFCDLADSTSLAERLDAEDLRELLDRYHATCREIIGRWDGAVAQFLGDGALAYFGYPVAHEDGAERALRAGLELLGALAGLGASGQPLVTRIAVHTGEVVLGRNRLAVGEAVHLAARLQALAEPDTLVISAATERLVRGAFVLEPRGHHAAKGFREPVPIWRVLRPTGARNRLDVAGGRLTLFVGRDAELATLRDRLERSREGEGQVVLVTGEAGVGKSRLVLELRHRLEADPHTWLVWRCSSYAQHTAFHPVVDMLRSRLADGTHETAARNLARLAQLLDDLGIGADTRHVFAELLGIPVPEAPPAERGRAEQSRRRLLDALVQWSIRLGDSRPAILVVEDLHWADPSTLELLGRVMAQGAMARLLLVLTARPDFAPPWPARSNVLSLTVPRLTRRHARAMLESLAGRRSLPPAAYEHVIDRGDGVPLHIEELTHALLEGDHEAPVPRTLQDALMARLDRLGAAREVAQRAAVIGREFPRALLAATAGLDEATIADALARLVRADILCIRGTPPDARYVFRHALVQDVAYGMLLRRTRQELHGRVAHALLEGPESAAPELVARHFAAAGRTDHALTHYLDASRRARERGAYVEAAEIMRQALALLAGSPSPDPREIPLQLSLATSLGARDLLDQGIEPAFERARELCEQTGDRRHLPVALIGLAARTIGSGDYARGKALAVEVLAAARAEDDMRWAIQAHAHLAPFEHVAGRFAISMDHCAEALALLDRVGRLDEMALAIVPIHVAVMARTWQAWNFYFLGFPDRALQAARDVVGLARRLEHPLTLLTAVLTRSLVHEMRGESEAQRDDAAQVMALADSYDLPYWRLTGHAYHVIAQGALGTTSALDEAPGVIDLLRGTLGAPAGFARLADAQLAAGRIADAEATMRAGRQLAADTKQSFRDADFVRLEGDLLLARGEGRTRAEALYRQALDVAHAQGSPALSLRAATPLAALLADAGRMAEARAILQPSYETFTEGFDTIDLRRAAAVLSRC